MTTTAMPSIASRVQKAVNLIDTSLDGVFIIEPKIFADTRGFFFESYNDATYAECGILDQFVQDNHSRSVKDTVRGLHYQLRFAQAKLCRVIQGEVLDVVVDIRYGSPKFGKWISVVLSSDNHRQIYIPRGYAHGFAVLSETAEFLYKCSDYYNPEDEYGVVWNDQEIGINWGIQNPILSQKDLRYPPLSAIPKENLMGYEKGTGQVKVYA
jgi:dTDP-4-dehydrorhamnose 3,5-epimerase